jgi:type IV secretion system protein VirB1
MPLDLAALQTLAEACAPAVAPTILLAIDQVESGFDPLAIGVNGPTPRRLSFASPAAAGSAARRLIAGGADVDLGLGQINARNLPRLGLSPEAAFDPCRNLAASARVLADDYRRIAPPAGREPAGLLTALSYYNTGRADRGFANGYVARVTTAAHRIAPALQASDAVPAPPSESARRERPAWAVFAATPGAPFVFSPSHGVSR